MGVDTVVATLEGSPITVEHVIVHLKATGAFRNAVYQIIENEVVRAKCREFGIEVSERELDEYAEARRYELGLDDALKMNEYCQWLGITFDEWSEATELDLLRTRLAHQVVDDDAIGAHYEQHKEALKTVSISRIVCYTKEEIDEALHSISADRRDFSSLAREVSIEEGTRNSGGYIGTVQAGMLSPEVERAVFEAGEHELVGPFVENGYWTAYHIERITRAELDAELEERIASQLFAEWLHEQVLRAEA